MKNYPIEIHSNNKQNDIAKLKSDIQKRDNVIQLLLGIIDIIKKDVNIKEQQLDYLLNHMKSNNYDDFSYKICINSFDKLINKHNNKEHSNTQSKIIIEYKTNCNYFLSLNSNIIGLICEFLPPRDLITFGLTCQKLLYITSSDFLWEKIYLSEFSNFLLFDEKDKCTIIKNPKDYFTTTLSLNQCNKKSFYKTEYKFIKKLNNSWETKRPIITTISTNSCITCLNLNRDQNELIYSDVDGSGGLFRLYPYRKIPSYEIYMQHHKQTKICDKLSSFYGHAGPIWCIDRNDDTLFTGSYDKTIKLWEIKTGYCKNTIRAHSSWVSGIQYDPLYDKLLSSSWDSTIKVWNMKTMENDVIINNQRGNYIYCIYGKLKDGKIYAGNEMRTVDVWDINKPGEKVHSFYGHLERVNTIKSYNNLIFSGSEDKHGRIWDVRTRNCEILLSGHLRGITQIDFDEISNRVFTASIDKTIKIWDIRKNTELRTLIGHSSSVYSIAFDHGKLISGSKDNSIKIWNFLT